MEEINKCSNCKHKHVDCLEQPCQGCEFYNRWEKC